MPDLPQAIVGQTYNYPKPQILTIADLLNGAEVKMPPAAYRLQTGGKSEKQRGCRAKRTALKSEVHNNLGGKMKRDMNLARRILLEVEKWPPEGGGGQIDVQGYDQQTISYHIMLLSEAGLLKGRDASGVGDICWFVDRLTWEGHEFVEAARDDTRWKKAISTISEKGGSFVFDVIKQLLVDLIKQAVFGHP